MATLSETAYPVSHTDMRLSSSSLRSCPACNCSTTETIILATHVLVAPRPFYAHKSRVNCFESNLDWIWDQGLQMDQLMHSWDFFARKLLEAWKCLLTWWECWVRNGFGECGEGGGGAGGCQLDSRTVDVFLNEQVPSIPGCATETQLTGNSGSLSWKREEAVPQIIVPRGKG